MTEHRLCPPHGNVLLNPSLQNFPCSRVKTPLYGAEYVSPPHRPPRPGQRGQLREIFCDVSERDSSAYRAQKPRPGRPEAGFCCGSLEPITAACVRHLPDGGGNRLWRVGQTSIGDAHNSALRWRARLETATAGLPWSTWRRFGCGWRMTMRTAIRYLADQN